MSEFTGGLIWGMLSVYIGQFIARFIITHASQTGGK